LFGVCSRWFGVLLVGMRGGLSVWLRLRVSGGSGCGVISLAIWSARGSHDDMFWALALAVYAADQIQQMSGPIARTI
jgi:hypothetical protein